MKQSDLTTAMWQEDDRLLNVLGKEINLKPGWGSGGDKFFLEIVGGIKAWP